MKLQMHRCADPEFRMKFDQGLFVYLRASQSLSAQSIRVPPKAASKLKNYSTIIIIITKTPLNYYQEKNIV